MIVSVLGDPSRELAFTSTVLDLDSKNYHTWAYRQWVLAHFGGLHKHDNKVEAPGAGAFPALWDGELAYVDNMLEADVRNNSAYNHRWFCVWGRLLEGRIVPPELEAKRQEEIDYALNKIAVAPNNASPWNYLRGYVARLTQRVHSPDAPCTDAHDRWPRPLLYSPTRPRACVAAARGRRGRQDASTCTRVVAGQRC